jgi:hypothetical protein
VKTPVWLLAGFCVLPSVIFCEVILFVFLGFLVKFLVVLNPDSEPILSGQSNRCCGIQEKPTAQTGTPARLGGGFGYCRNAKPTLKKQKSRFLPTLDRKLN